MKVYFNWLGQWIPLENTAKINDMSLNEYTEKALQDNYLEQSLAIIKVTTVDNEYYIRANNLVWTRILNIQENNESNNMPFELKSNEESDNSIIDW